MTEVSLAIEIDSHSDGTLHMKVRCVYPDLALYAPPSVVAVRIRPEGDDEIRLALIHCATRALAYVQGNRALYELWRRIRLDPAPIEDGRAE